MSEDVFAKALRNFTMDAAAGDAIRHLTDKGYTPTQIRETLTFPAPMEYVVKVMWERFVETRVIVLEDPGLRKGDDSVKRGDGSSVSFSICSSTVKSLDENETEEPSPRFTEEPSPRFTSPSCAYEIVERVDRYGKKSFLRVKKESSEEVIFSPEDYVLCDYGRRIANGEVFENEFIAMLPWPDKPVWVLSGRI